MASKLDPKIIHEIQSLGARDMESAKWLFAEIARIGVAVSRVNACLRTINSLMTRNMSVSATVHGLCGGDDTAIRQRAAKLHEIFPELVVSISEVTGDL